LFLSIKRRRRRANKSHFLCTTAGSSSRRGAVRYRICVLRINVVGNYYKQAVHALPAASPRRSACSIGLSTTSQQYFSLRTNQPLAINQQYFSLRTNQHQPSATSQTNRLDQYSDMVQMAATELAS
jgi:hypothetical protein